MKSSTSHSIRHPALKGALYSAALMLALGLAAPVFADAGQSAGASQQASPGQQAQPQHHWRHHRRHHEMKVLHHLNLTDAQKKQVRALFKQAREAMRPRYKALRAAHRAFAVTTPGTKAFNDTYLSYSREAADFAQQRVKTNADLRTEIYNLLDAQQRKELIEMKAEHNKNLH